MRTNHGIYLTGKALKHTINSSPAQHGYGITQQFNSLNGGP